MSRIKKWLNHFETLSPWRHLETIYFQTKSEVVELERTRSCGHLIFISWFSDVTYRASSASALLSAAFNFSHSPFFFS